MAHPFQQQFTSPYPTQWPPTNFSAPGPYSYHPAYPPIPLAHTYSPTSPHAGPGQGQFHFPPLVQPALPSYIQMLGQEVAEAQMRLMSALVHAELEKIDNTVCLNCKERNFPGNLGQHPPVFASQIPTVPTPTLQDEGRQQAPVILPRITPGAPVSFPSSLPDGHNNISPQANFSNIRMTNTGLVSPIPTTPSHILAMPAISNVSTPSDSAEPSPINETAAIAPPLWSVIYNSEIEKALDVTFVHAFHHTSPVCAVRFSPDGKFLAAVLDCHLGMTQIYDMDTRSMKCSLAEPLPPDSEQDEYPSRGIWCVCFSPDGRYVVVGSSFERIYVWEIASKKVLAAFKGHAGAVRSLDLSPDGNLLVTGSNDCSVRIWKVRDGSSKILSTEGNIFTSVMFTPNGCHVAASNMDRFLRIWDVRSGQLLRKWNGHQAGIRSFAISPDGEELVSGSWGGEIKSWDISSLEVPRPGLPADSEERAEGHSGTLIQKTEKMKFDGHSGEVRTVAVSPDGKWVVTGSTDKRVRIWDMCTAVLQCTLEGHSSFVWTVDFSPVGNYIAIGSGADFVTVWGYSETE